MVVQVFGPEIRRLSHPMVLLQVLAHLNVPEPIRRCLPVFSSNPYADEADRRADIDASLKIAKAGVSCPCESREEIAHWTNLVNVLEAFRILGPDEEIETREIVVDSLSMNDTEEFSRKVLRTAKQIKAGLNPNKITMKIPTADGKRPKKR